MRILILASSGKNCLLNSLQLLRSSGVFIKVSGISISLSLLMLLGCSFLDPVYSTNVKLHQYINFAGSSKADGGQSCWRPLKRRKSVCHRVLTTSLDKRLLYLLLYFTMTTHNNCLHEWWVLYQIALVTVCHCQNKILSNERTKCSGYHIIK